MAMGIVYKDSETALTRLLKKGHLLDRHDKMDMAGNADFSNVSFKKFADGNQQSKGLTDVTNNEMKSGYINKIRRDSVGGKMKETKKMTVVASHSHKISFKPNTNAGGRHAGAREKRPFAVSVPDHTVPGGLSPMDTDVPQVRIRHVMTRVPRGVIDIDAISDPLKNTEYAEDICVYLQSVERRWTYPETYLLDSKDITPHMRCVLVDWLIQVQVHQEVSQTTLHLAVGLIDHYLSLQTVQLNVLQLVGITCLWIGAKFNERFPPEVADLCHLTDNTYSTVHVIRMERRILKTLEFDLNLPGPTVFLERFLLVRDCENTHLVQSMSMFILDLTLTEFSMVHFYPSLLAASAICLSRELLGCEPAWDTAFAHYTKYSMNDLDSCIRALKRLLGKMRKSKFQSTHLKYAQSSFHGISDHHSLKHLSLHPTELWPLGSERPVPKPSVVNPNTTETLII